MLQTSHTSPLTTEPRATWLWLRQGRVRLLAACYTAGWLAGAALPVTEWSDFLSAAAPAQLSSGWAPSEVRLSCVRLWVSVVTHHWYPSQTYQHYRWGSRPSLLPIRSTGEHGTVWARQWGRRGWGLCTKVRISIISITLSTSQHYHPNSLGCFNVSHHVRNIMSWEQVNYKQYITFHINQISQPRSFC